MLANSENDMRLFPYALVRISGGPFDRLAALEASGMPEVLSEIRDLKQRQAEIASRVTDTLYKAISSCVDSPLRTHLIHLKRDVFNGRVVSPDQLSLTRSNLPCEAVNDLVSYMSICRRLSILLEQGREKHSAASIHARKVLRQLAQEDVLRKGLVLSSQSLLRYGLPRYISTSGQNLNHRDLQTEHNLLRYMSRIYAKTSPFSTFTALAIMHIKAGTLSDESTIGSPPSSSNNSSELQVTSHVRLNNSLFEYLVGLMSKNARFYRHFALRLNPTLRKEDGEYVYLVNFHNIEAFQRIPDDPTLELIISLLSQQIDGLAYHEAVQQVLDSGLLDASRDDLELYLIRLVEYGFLEINVGISGLDPDWDVKLIQQLSLPTQCGNLVGDLISALKSLRITADQYGEAHADRRPDLLMHAFDTFKELCLRLHEDAGLPEAERQLARAPGLAARNNTHERDAESHIEDEGFKSHIPTAFRFRAERMFFEDATVHNCPEINKDELQQLVMALSQLFSETRRFELHFDERAKMLQYFIWRYGSGATVDLLPFYEDYYRDYKVPEAQYLAKISGAQKETDDNGNINAPPDQLKPIPPELFRLARVHERQKENAEWLREFATLKCKPDGAADNDEIHFGLDHLRNANRLHPTIACSSGRSSHDVFIQLFTKRQANGGERLMGVLNSKFPGFGKMFSRFLHLFDESFTEELRAWINAFSNGDLFLDNCDSSVFNANMHPSLFPYEVVLPNGQNSVSREKQIRVSDLQVRVASDGNQLALIHSASGKRVHVFDTGFLSLGNRSQLFQLLEQFTLAEVPIWASLIKYLSSDHDDSEHHEKSIRLIPRIVYEDRLILQRQTWRIPKELIPIRQHCEADWDYFERLNEWRCKQGIPSEVFVYVASPLDLDEAKRDPSRRLNSDERKPQYISFNSPLLVNLFAILLQRVASCLDVVEMLPSSADLLKINNRPFVTEFVIEWYTAES